MKLFVWDFFGVLDKPAENAREVLEAIQKANHDQIIISSVFVTTLSQSLERVGFQDIFPETKRFGVSDQKPGLRTKRQILEAYLKGKDFDEIVVIGDSQADIALTEVEGGVSYLFSYPERLFCDANADHKIHDLDNLKNEL